jgi:hypothetical protein
MDDLREDNCKLYAAKNYDKPSALQSEFDEDFLRLLYIKRLLTKYYSTKVLKDRLIMNHLIIFYNVFGLEAATRMLFLKLDEKDLKVIKPFLLFLSYLPETVGAINGRDIDTYSIGMDQVAVGALRNLK